MALHMDIKATHMDLTDAIRDYALEKVGKLEKLLDPEDTSVHAQVEVGKTTEHHSGGDVFRAEINLHTAGANFRAVSETDDLYAAIDKMEEEIMKEVRRAKGKEHDQKLKGARTAKEVLRESE